MKKLISLIFAFQIITNIHSYANENINSVDSILYKAYISQNKNIPINLIKKLSKEKSSFENTFLLLKVQYALLYFNTYYNPDKELHNTYINEAKANADKLIENNQYLTEVYTIKASLYGIEIGFSPMKGVYLGSSIEACINKAAKCNQFYPFLWATKGRALVSKPSAFGGDINAGIEMYNRALTLYINGKTKWDWEFLDTNLQIALAYLNLNDKEKAKIYLCNILKIEPDFELAKWFLNNKCN